MGEEDEMSNGEFERDDDDIEEQIPVRKMVNLAKMYGSLVANGSLPLTVLKVCSNPLQKCGAIQL